MPNMEIPDIDLIRAPVYIARPAKYLPEILYPHLLPDGPRDSRLPFLSTFSLSIGPGHCSIYISLSLI